MDDLIEHTKVTKVTIQRRLKEIEYITSYNHNGMYYTLLKFSTSLIFTHILFNPGRDFLFSSD